MDLLPDLSQAEEAFASAFFPVFSCAKTGVLLIAGTVLLMSDSESDEDPVVRESFARARDRLGEAQTLWQTYDCPDSLIDHYRDVLKNLKIIAAVGDRFETLSAAQLCAEKAALTERISNALAQLRQITLQYWHLELVPESVHHHHEHAH